MTDKNNIDKNAIYLKLLDLFEEKANEHRLSFSEYAKSYVALKEFIKKLELESKPEIEHSALMAIVKDAEKTNHLLSECLKKIMEISENEEYRPVEVHLRFSRSFYEDRLKEENETGKSISETIEKAFKFRDNARTVLRVLSSDIPNLELEARHE